MYFNPRAIPSNLVYEFRDECALTRATYKWSWIIPLILDVVVRILSANVTMIHYGYSRIEFRGDSKGWKNIVVTKSSPNFNFADDSLTT